MRTHVLALAASVAALSTAAPLPAQAQGMGLGSLFSCNGRSGSTGAVLGGIAGALAGSQVSKNETLGAVVGAGLGAVAGGQLACRMNSSSRVQAQDAFQRTLETGRAQSWYDSRTGARGRIEVVDHGGAPYAGDYGRHVSATDLRFGRGVERVYRLSSAAPTYRADRRVNVRSAPELDAPIVDTFTRGETFETAGVTADGWLAVEEAGMVIGYVPDDLVTPAAGMTYARGDGCRVVQQTVTMRGYPSEVQRFNACRDRSGEWRLTPM
jgi:surface antigen